MNNDLIMNLPSDVVSPTVGLVNLPGSRYSVAGAQAGRGIGIFTKHGNNINTIWRNVVHGTMTASKVEKVDTNNKPTSG